MQGTSRREFLTRSALLAGSALLPKIGLAADAKQRPNIVLCMADDQGWGDTGYNGHPILRTPNLDQMAKDGVCFERFYAGAPVCSPTRASCITGRHPYRIGIPYANTGRMKQEEVTLAEALKPLGYAAGHFGKWHLGTLTSKIKDANRGRPGKTKHYSPPWQNGFDVCFSTESKVPTYWKPGAYDTYGTHYWTGPDQMVPSAEIHGDDSVLIMNQALPFIRQASKAGTPFLAVIWFHTPHLPVVSVPPYTDGYEKHKNYYGCITAMDEQVGRLREELKNLGVADDTMLWFCSDNGPEGKDTAPGRTGGLRGRKRSLYEGGVRVPGLLVWPSMVQESRAISMPCCTSDYFPTVLDALGHDIPETRTRPYDGMSLLPAILGKQSERPNPIGFESKNQVSLTGNRYKIYSKDRGKTYELYDLVDDPGEKRNIAAQHPDIVQRMRQTVEAWRQSCQDSLRGRDYGTPAQ